MALRVLRGNPGADTATVGAWASGARADLMVAALVQGSQVHYVINQNATVPAAAAPLYRQLAARRLPVLGLYGGNAPETRLAANRLRGLVGTTRHGGLVRTYRTALPSLLVPGGIEPVFAPGLPEEVAEWIRAR